MDVTSLVSLVGGTSLIGIGIAVGRQMTIRRDITALDHAVHKINNRLAAFPERPDDVYARKDTVEAQLEAISATQAHIQADITLIRQFLAGRGGGVVV